jgi:aspartate racemase
MRRGDKDEINQSYLDVALRLQAAGAKAILICANTPHMVHPFVAPKIKIPILHIADATGQEAKSKGIKQLGLLGNRPTMTGGFIQNRLKEHFDIDTIIPNEEFVSQSHHYISTELTQGKFSPAAKDFFLNQMELLKERGAEGMILGCTELPMLIDQQDFSLPLMDTTELHIQMGVDFIMGNENK